MRKLQKPAALLLVLALVLSLSVAAFAQDVPYTGNDAGSATITIENAAKGETYTIYKLFDATVSEKDSDDDGVHDSIAYTGNIPASFTVDGTIYNLGDYFEKDAKGNISARANINESALFAALKAYVEQESVTATKDAVSDGSELKFTDLPYGYYVVTSTQGTSAITVTSTQPNATIYDKNSTEPSQPDDGKVKDADHTNVNIGDTVTYTVKFNTTNYTGAGETAKKIVSYTITDTLPSFLTDVSVTAIYVDDDHDLLTTNDQTPLTVQQFSKDNTTGNGTITIPWTDSTTGASLYTSGTMLVITYTAKVTDSAQIAGAGNKNEVTISWTDEEENQPGDNDKITGDETIYTYAIAIKKVSDTGTDLSGATFQLPFYVSTTTDGNGYYVYAGAKVEGQSAPANTTDTVTTPNNGEIVVKGVANATYSITETVAPKGYNKLADPVSVTAQPLTATTTSTTKYINDKGEIVDTQTDVSVTYTNNNLAATAVFVVNNTGTTLPATGGMGTTVLYVIGAVLVLGAGVALVVRRRMRAED